MAPQSDTDHVQELRHLTEKVDQLSTDVKDLVDAWNAGKGLVKLVKLIGILAAAFASVWALVHIGKAT